MWQNIKINNKTDINFLIPTLRPEGVSFILWEGYYNQLMKTMKVKFYRYLKTKT